METKQEVDRRGGVMKLMKDFSNLTYFQYCSVHARFTKHLKPKFFISSIQSEWNIRKSKAYDVK